MKNILFTIFCLLCEVNVAYAQPQARLLMHGEGLSELNLLELPELGLCINLDGDSLIYLDDPELPILHLDVKRDTREIIVCDTTIYVSVENAVYADTCNTPLIIMDNNMFSLYPACGSSFYVCTADSAYSDLILVDPVAGAYSIVTKIEAPIQKVVANDTYTLALINNQIVALGANNAMLPLYQGEEINDMAISPLGLFVATDEGLFLTQNPSEVKCWSKKKYTRVWWVNESLYLLDAENNLYAIDGLLEQGD